jgi:polysaccharide biosynthesis/export protein
VPEVSVLDGRLLPNGFFRRIIMRQALWSTLFALLPLLCYGQDSKPPAAPAQQGEQTPAPPPIVSHKATIPSGTPVTQAPPAADPTKADPVKAVAPPKGDKAAAPVDDKTYVIGAEDVLQIDVWDDTRLSRAHSVRPDGYISMPLINEIKAADKTPSQLREEIIERLKAGEYLKSPEVNVSVQEVRSKFFLIQGEVGKPGKYPLLIPTRVLEALVNAGGFAPFADQKKIVIQRGTERFKFNYKEVIDGKKLEQNILLQPGDLIIVK